MKRLLRRSTDSPLFLSFGLGLGLVGVSALVAGTARLGASHLYTVVLLAAIALTMRLNTFTIPPRIVVSLVYTVQMAAVILLGGTEAAWISVATFLIAILIRRSQGVARRVFLAVVSFNVGMEALMTLGAGAAYGLARRALPAATTAHGGGADLLTVEGLASMLVLVITLKLINEALMTLGSFLRGIPVADYLAGARKVLLVEAGMLPLGMLLALIGLTAGERGLAVAVLVLFFATVLVKKLSDTRDEVQRINVNLERRLGELDVLDRVGRAISSAIEIDQVLDAIHRHCSELVDTRNFFIALLDREASEFEVALIFERGERLPNQRLSFGEGLTTLVVQRREPLLIANLDREAQALPVKPVLMAPMVSRSWLGVPLIAGDEVLGVITVQDERAEAYDQDTVRVLTTIAAHAAISIKNAQLVKRIVDQARLEQENLSLRIFDQRKNDFVNMVAHQLQSPLTAIIGFSDLVRRTPESPDAAGHLEMIHRESRRLSSLVDQLLSLARIRSGRISTVRRRVDLNAIAREVVDSQVLLIREKEVRIEVGLESSELPVSADPALLHQAVANLVNNALKYSPVRSTVSIRTARQRTDAPGAGDLAHFEVRDSGPGVDPREREKIFEDFYRASATEIRQVKGSGLGLSIAREIVHLHGGRIQIEAAPGGGSVFSFSIPATS